MKILITGGNTYVPIDKVRGITNIFKGKTACDIAFEALGREHDVVLLGNPEMEQRVRYVPANNTSLEFKPYRTYDELMARMHDTIAAPPGIPNAGGGPDVIVHSAAVSDYKVARVYGADEMEHPVPRVLPLTKGEVARDGKISSSHKRLIIELEPTEKIVDKIRDPWGFKNLLVKFKLQVDMGDEELLRIAKKSRDDSGAEIMVANCLEWARERAYILSGQEVLNVKRRNLAGALLDKLEILGGVGEF